LVDRSTWRELHHFFASEKAPLKLQATLARRRSIKVIGTPSTALGSAKSNVMGGERLIHAAGVQLGSRLILEL
jgi:hypothetical protein